MSKPRVTIKDLAKELKISTSTVSRALCDKWDVNPETRKAVLELAEKWNYKPNPISLSLKQSQSMFIGVIVPEFVNSFFSEVIMGIQSVLNPEGYHVLIMQSNESHENELRNMKALEAQMVDGEQQPFGRNQFARAAAVEQHHGILHRGFVDRVDVFGREAESFGAHVVDALRDEAREPHALVGGGCQREERTEQGK